MPRRSGGALPPPRPRPEGRSSSPVPSAPASESARAASGVSAPADEASAQADLRERTGRPLGLGVGAAGRARPRGEGGREGAGSFALGADDGLGSADLSRGRFRAYADLVAVRHLYHRMARPRRDRGVEVEALADLLLGLEDGARARRLLELLLRVERFFDLYPLELAWSVLERAPGYLPGVERGSLIRNKRFLEERMFAVEEIIPLEVPLAARIRGFALAGGGTPGYVLSPGPPARYHLELGAEGRFEVLLSGRLRGNDLVDSVRLWVEDPPESAIGW